MIIQQNISIINQLVNYMMGGALLILPILFNQGGIILSTVVLVVSGYICYTTCYLYVTHNRHDEKEIEDTVLRILGKQWYTFFCFISSIYLFTLCVTQYMQIVEMLYELFDFIQYFTDIQFLAPPQIITFEQFGMLWITLIVAFPIGILLFLDINKIFKIMEIGAYFVYAYLIFIIYIFLENITSGRIKNHFEDVKLFSWDIGNLAGTCSLAFTLHTGMLTILKQQNDQESQKKNLKFAYIVGFILYFSAGFIGGIGIIGRNSNVSNPQSVTQYFPDEDKMPTLAEFIYLVTLISVMPSLFNIFRERILNFIFHNHIPNRGKQITNFIFLFIVIILSNIPNLQTGDLMSANGSICCFFIVYLLPIMIHLHCYYGKQKSHTVISINNDDCDSTYQERDNKIIESAYIKKKINIDQKHERIISYQDTCNDHDNEINQSPKQLRLLYYGSMLLIGIFVLVYGLYNIFFRQNNEFGFENSVQQL